MERNRKLKPRFEERYTLGYNPEGCPIVDWVNIERKYLDREPTAKDKRCEKCQYWADENGNTFGVVIKENTWKNSAHLRDKDADPKGKAPSTRDLLPNVLPCNLARDPGLSPDRHARGLYRRQRFSQLGAVKTLKLLLPFSFPFFFLFSPFGPFFITCLPRQIPPHTSPTKEMYGVT